MPLRTPPGRLPARSGLAAVAAALVVLAVQLWQFDLRPSNIGDDFVAYISNARSLVTGAPYGMPGYTLNPHYDKADSGQGAYPPGYPIVLAPVVALAQDPVGATALFNCFIYAAFAGLLAVFAAPATGRYGAAALAVTVGVSPMFLNEGTLRTPTEPLYLLVLVGAFLSERLLDTARRTRAGPVLLLGAMIAAASLIRVTGIVLGPAVILADIARRRRLAWPAFLAAGVAGVLFVAVIVGVSLDYVVQNFGVLGTGSPAVAGPGGSAMGAMQRHGRVILENFAAMPGNLTTMWTYLGPDAAPVPGIWGSVRKAGTLLLVGLAAFGFIHQAWRRVSLAETYFVLQIALLLNLTEILRSPRYWIPVSALALVYAVAGGRVLGALAWRGVGGALAAVAVAAVACGLALGSDAALRPDPYALNERRAVDAFARLRSDVPADSVIVSRRPRTVVFYAGRTSADYHLDPAQPGFWAWADGIGATHLMLSIDQPEALAIAARRSLPRDDAGLQAALNEYEERFFGESRARFSPVFDNGRYRLYRIGRALP